MFAARGFDGVSTTAATGVGASFYEYREDGPRIGRSTGGRTVQGPAATHRLRAAAERKDKKGRESSTPGPNKASLPTGEDYLRRTIFFVDVKLSASML